MKRLNKILLSSGFLVLILAIPTVVILLRPIEIVYPIHDEHTYYYIDDEPNIVDRWYLFCNYYEEEGEVLYYTICSLKFVVP
ncbi:MAG: hypothetical protein ACFFD2_22175 [Promethearchaeota archaeon]